MNMTDYKVIYKDVVYNCITVHPMVIEKEVTELEVIFIDEDNRISVINGKAVDFQFIRK